MPQLEETRKLVPKTSPSSSDLLAIFDVAEVGNNTVKKSTITQVASSGIAGLPLASNDAEAAAYGVLVGYPYVSSVSYAVTIRAA